jgi:uncharacterized membrane protein YczE
LNFRTNSFTFICALILTEKSYLRQAASFSFKLASIATAAFASISLIGAGLLLSGNLSEGTLTTASGAGSSIYFFKLAKDANDRLDRIFAELND